MADRQNDTDPQSPRARAFRTDPGIGEPTPIPARAAPVPTPSPGSASIEELLDGITGPRPPPSRREGGSASRAARATPTPPPGAARSTSPPEGMRAYAAARPAPASSPMPPHEPAVVSPPPPSLSQETTSPRKGPEPDSTRPTVRRIAEERTVYTGRRALIRNFSVVVASAGVVTLMMMSIMRWKEQRRARVPAVVVAAPQLDPEPAPSPEPTGAQAQVAAPVAVRGSASTPVSSELAPAASAGASTAAPASSAKPGVLRRTKGEGKPASPPRDSLDDLNRQIRH
jgi:hypothetical protein